MADVAASPDKLVLEGELYMERLFLFEGAKIEDDYVCKQLWDWISDTRGIPRTGDIRERLDGTYRITVERLTDDG